MTMIKSATAVGLAMALGLGTAVFTPALAADQPATAPSRTQTPSATSTVPGGIASDDIIGRTVVNRRDENIGKVEELVVRPKQNDIYAVLSVGGFLGLGDHDVVVPMKDLTITPEKIILTSGQTKEDLKKLPEYDEKAWDEVPGRRPATTPRTGQ